MKEVNNEPNTEKRIDGIMVADAIKRKLKKGKDIDNKIKIKNNIVYKNPIIYQLKTEAGRPTKMTEAVVAKLLWAFANDYNNEEACIYSGISVWTLGRYKEENEDFAKQIELIRNNPNMIAKTILVDSLLRGNVEDAKWWLTKKNKAEFGEPEQLPMGGTMFQQTERTVKTEVSETTIKSKTLTLLKQMKPDVQI
jgi:hypothetical protein